MGNIIAIISWAPTDNDHMIISQLRKLSIDCGLSPDTDSNLVGLYEYETINYAADISGIYLALGRELQRNKVRYFCAKSMELLEFLNVRNPRSRVEDLAI